MTANLPGLDACPTIRALSWTIQIILDDVGYCRSVGFRDGAELMTG
jgi:hypothetical protein